VVTTKPYSRINKSYESLKGVFEYFIVKVPRPATKTISLFQKEDEKEPVGMNFWT